MIVQLAPDGKMIATSTVPTAKGARNAVATEDGTAFIADGPAGMVLVVPPQLNPAIDLFGNLRDQGNFIANRLRILRS